MDEEKAANYYEEMLRKGGGAAKLKRGLGYGCDSSQGSSAAAFPSFVRGDNHEESLAKLEKENRLAAVRDKLKRGRLAKNEIYDDDFVTSNRRHSSPSPSREGKSRPTARRSRSPSASRSLRRDTESPSRRERSHRKDRRSGSSSPVADHTSDCRSFSRSPSSDKNKPHRGERSKQDTSSRVRRRSRSPRHSSRRSRSVSPADRERHLHRASSKDGHNHRNPTSVKERDRRHEPVTKVVKKLSSLDYAKLIPGFEKMTSAEKIKEKMKLQLSDAVSKDTAKGIDADWERFVFNKNAPLDDDAKLDDFGDGTGAQDDTEFLQHTGSSLLSANASQAKREAQIQAAHDAAIFGPPLGKSSDEKVPFCVIEARSPSNEWSFTDATTVEPERASPKSSLLSDQISAFQQGSWRERALRLKQQRDANTFV